MKRHDHGIISRGGGGGRSTVRPSIDRSYFIYDIYIYIFPALDGIRKIEDERNTKGRERIKM